MCPDTQSLRRRRAIRRQLDVLYPNATCALAHANAFELLSATILSAQCTDRLVNRITPALFARYPDARAMATASSDELEHLVQSVNFYRTKAKNLRATAGILCARHRGDVPATLAELIALPGVARKTANVVLGICFGRAEGFVVDTHVARLAQRLGWTAATRPQLIERDLMATVPRGRRIKLANQLIAHGRQICVARRPRCDACALRPLCPTGTPPSAPATQANPASVAPSAAPPARRTRPVASTTAVSRGAAAHTPRRRPLAR